MDQITTYATLQSAVAGMLHRASDTAITDNVPLFIQLCEAELNDEMLLKDMESEESLSMTVGQNYVALPTGFVSPIAMWLVIDDVRTKLDQALPQELPYINTNGQPEYWAVDAANVRFDRPADQAYDLKFRIIKKSNLSGSVTSNALLLHRPDVYLYGTLRQAAIFADDDRNLQKWTRMYEIGKRALAHADSKSRSGVPLRTDIGIRGGGSYDIYGEQ